MTTALLVLGFGGMLLGVYAGFNLELVIAQGGLIQGTDPVVPSWTGAAGWSIIVSHVILYAVAVIGARSRLQAGRPAFWVPLAAGVVAAIIYNGVLMAVGLASGMFGSLVP